MIRDGSRAVDGSASANIGTGGGRDQWEHAGGWLNNIRSWFLGNDAESQLPNSLSSASITRQKHVSESDNGNKPWMKQLPEYDTSISNCGEELYKTKQNKTKFGPLFYKNS